MRRGIALDGVPVPEPTTPSRAERIAREEVARAFEAGFGGSIPNDRIMSIRVQRAPQIEVTAFGDTAPVYLAQQWCWLEIRVANYFDCPPGTRLILDAVVGGIRYEGTIEITEVSIEARVGEIIATDIKAWSSDFRTRR